MNDEPISSPIERYIAIDTHKHYATAGGMYRFQLPSMAEHKKLEHGNGTWQGNASTF